LIFPPSVLCLPARGDFTLTRLRGSSKIFRTRTVAPALLIVEETRARVAMSRA